MTESSDRYAQFEVARCEAMALTDQFHDLSSDDPNRSWQWERAMRQTERARQLLEAWLHSEQSATRDLDREVALA